jgi:cytochrome c-type biogenesis protein CcmH
MNNVRVRPVDLFDDSLEKSSLEKSSFPRRRESILPTGHSNRPDLSSSKASRFGTAGSNNNVDSRLRGNDVRNVLGIDVRKVLGVDVRKVLGVDARKVLGVCAGLLAVLFVFSLPAFAAVDPLPFKDHAEELRFQALTKQLRCLVCQNESLNDSAAPLAADLRRDVFEQIQAGKSDAEIKTWLTARYSDFVLYDPPLRGGTWLLWFGPLLVLVAGGAAVFVVVRRRAKVAGAVAGTRATASARPASDVEDDW